MTDLLLIDADALKESWVRSNHKGTLIDFIDNAPLVPAVPLEDHERMKRELYSEITLLKKQIAEVTAERDQAVEDLRKVSSCATCKFNSDDLCRQAENDEDFQKHREAHERWNSCKGSVKLNWQWRGVAEKQTLSTATKNNILNDFMKGVE